TIFTNKHLAVVTKHLSENKPILCYLGMIELEDCSAKTMTINLKRFILAKLLNIENLVHFGSNDASIMLGYQNRAAWLKKYNLFITKNYCIAHYLHLAGQDAAKKVSYFEKYKKLVKRIYTYFSSSYKRLLTLKIVQNTLKEPEIMILNISIEGALLDEAANNMQAAILLADIDQTFEIVTIQFSIFISEFASATITSLNNYFPNRKLYEAIKIYNPKQLLISDNDLANYGNEAINILSNFYRTEKIINNQQFIPLLEKKDLINE
ncbi:8522_t:CDS:2, partial [Cetraspora pellucida]